MIELALASPAGKEPLALQWDLRIPLAPAALVDDRLLVGFVAREAAKSLYCAPPTKMDETHTVRCILAGGRKPIPNGTIALLKLKIATHAPIGSTRVRVERGLAVSRDLEQVPLRVVETTVAIRR